MNKPNIDTSTPPKYSSYSKDYIFTFDFCQLTKYTNVMYLIFFYISLYKLIYYIKNKRKKVVFFMDCTLMLGDCLEKMERIHDKSIDMIICDLPYG
ncbi:putative cytosine-specific methyltransferase (plasmid) [Clostridium perfringens]|uniref:Putative cytosine-specific methyltransferase n=1 Tax=Clostridium perfringens TaxID=1502 RepID=A0A140GS83_CLOPF|nr:putative cytosine-specific methyltransferase [Clostridium perfringens]